MSIANAVATILRSGRIHLMCVHAPNAVKPDNILIDKKGNAKICDFNLAREVGPRERMAGWLMTGGIGSYRYMVTNPFLSRCLNAATNSHRSHNSTYKLGPRGANKHRPRGICCLRTRSRCVLGGHVHVLHDHWANAVSDHVGVEV